MLAVLVQYWHVTDWWTHDDSIYCTRVASHIKVLLPWHWRTSQGHMQSHTHIHTL